MKKQPQREQHHGHRVWVNSTTESMRKKECLCLNCGKFKPDQPDHCPIAQSFYKLCVAGKNAITMTRCKPWESKTS